MKKLLAISLFSVIGSGLCAQNNTAYGTNAGVVGLDGSYFGYEAGNAVISTSQYNTFLGARSGKFTTTGDLNVGVAVQALYSNTSGSYNSATGVQSLYSNTSGTANTANGYRSLYTATTANYNTATGAYSLYFNTGGYNVANGFEALYSNTSATYNVAVGYRALRSNTTGSSNSAIGYDASYTNSTGSGTTAFGYRALRNNTASYNVGVGNEALYTHSTGEHNTAVGTGALYSSSSSSYNTAVGSSAAPYVTTGTGNTAVGRNAMFLNQTGDNNTAIGHSAGPDVFSGYSNTTALGYNTVVTASNQIRIGDANVTSIGGQVGWTTLSDGRFKQDIDENVAGLDFITQLRPVSYSINKKAFNSFVRRGDDTPASANAEATRHTGFIAQEVDKLVKENKYAFHGVDAPKNQSDYYGIRYEEFVVPLVKAVQELSQKINQQQFIIDELLLARGGDKDNTNLNGSSRLFETSPNPFSNATNIKMVVSETVRNARIVIYNLEGKQLKEFPVTARGETTLSINVDELAAGLYFYALLTDGNLIDTKRMVLTR